MRLAYLRKKTARLLREYSTAIRVNAGGRLSQLPRSAWEIAVARLVYDIGPINHALYRLSRVPRNQWTEYITDGPDFKDFLRARNPESGRRITGNKLAFYRHCHVHGLPTLPILCTLTTGEHCADIGVPNVGSLAEWRTALADAPGELFIKPVDGTHGEGAFTALLAERRASFAGRSGSIDDLYEHVRQLRGHEAGWMVQPRAYPHERLVGLVSPRSLATVRIMTEAHDGRATVLGAILKITVGNNVIDNFVFGSTGNLVADIDVATGCIGTAWGSSSIDWPVIEAFENHPESGKRFAGAEIPFWNELVELALRGQRSFANMRTLGWDIAIAREGVTIVEVNSTYDVVLLQLARQRGLRQFMYEALA